MSNPLKPHWAQPSHPEIQEVITGEDGGASFSTRSVSRVQLAPMALYARLTTPPCTFVDQSTYATVQVGRDRHVMLNSDLLYLNHSCEPSLILAGPRGLAPGDELTFFYPSTEWHMAQPFACACGTPSCRGRISGARDMTARELEGYWLSGHVKALKAEQEGSGGTSEGRAEG